MTKRRRHRGGLYKQAGSPYYYADYIDGAGKRRRRSTGKMTKKEAERVRAQWLNEEPELAGDVTFAELRDDMQADYVAQNRK